jgi:hypothetical protein
MSYRLGESDEAIIMAQVVIMFMEGNQILESFAKKKVAYLELCLLSFVGQAKYDFTGLKKKDLTLL